MISNGLVGAVSAAGVAIATVVLVGCSSDQPTPRAATRTTVTATVTQEATVTAVITATPEPRLTPAWLANRREQASSDAALRCWDQAMTQRRTMVLSGVADQVHLDSVAESTFRMCMAT